MPTEPKILVLLAYYLCCIGWTAFQFRKLDISALDPGFALHPANIGKFNIPALIAAQIAFLLGFGLNHRGRAIWRKVLLGLGFLAVPALVAQMVNA